MKKLRKGILRDDALNNHIKEFVASLSDEEKEKILKQQQEVIEWLRDNFVKKNDNGETKYRRENG